MGVAQIVAEGTGEAAEGRDDQSRRQIDRAGEQAEELHGSRAEQAREGAAAGGEDIDGDGKSGVATTLRSGRSTSAK